MIRGRTKVLSKENNFLTNKLDRSQTFTLLKGLDVKHGLMDGVIRIANHGSGYHKPLPTTSALSLTSDEWFSGKVILNKDNIK